MMRLMAILAAALLAAAPGLAAALVDTGQATNTNAGYTLAGPASSIHEDISWAARFTLAGPAVIASLEAGLQTIEGGDVVFALYDAALGLPQASTPLFTTTVSLVAATPYPALDWNGAFGLSWAVDAGTYWFAILPAAGSTVWTSLNFDPPHPLAAYASRQTGQAWSADPSYSAFAVRISDATVVPEPASWMLLVAGFGLTGAALRRRDRRAAATLI